MAKSVAAVAFGSGTNEYASPYLRYFFCYREIVEDFTNQRTALELRKQRVQTRVDEAQRQIEVIYEDVEDWLIRAEIALEETQNLQDEIDRVKCFKWCPKWGWRYSLRKKLAEKTAVISKLLEASNFPLVGYRPLLEIKFITSTHFLDNESSKSVLNWIMEAINDNGVNMIGLYGMPGVGKTTLAIEFGKCAREQRLFDKVVMFTMSQNPNIRAIQDKVADMFGLKFRNITEEGRAEELFSTMQGVNKILVIIDDLWEEFKLERIGIPFGDEHKGCKILLTTRHQQVCTKMNCQKEIKLSILSADEAWVLFRDEAGLEDDSSILNGVAKEVAGECKGLPLAIVTVAKALKGESLDGWRAANHRFKNLRHLDNEEVLGGVFKALKLSYDYLKEGNNQMTGNDIQMCFLLCSLFPEDAEIAIDILTMCGIGVGLFPNASSIEDKRNKIEAALKKLQKSGLLLETDNVRTIRMHDVVRDFAHWLASTGENRFMVKDKSKKWPRMFESFECYTAVALWKCSSNIKNFPDKVEFSKLKTLFFGGERKWRRDDLLVVSSTFFEEMKALQVLYLKWVRFSLKGFNSLPNLKTLWCKDCIMENFSSSMTNMRSLEILALIGTEIDEISEELVELSTLKYLRLSGVGVQGEMKFPPKLVSRLTSLQELHVTSKNNINLLELNFLSRLTTLSLRLSTNQISQEDFVFPKLQSYTIDVDYCISFHGMLNFRNLAIENFSSSLSAFKNLFYNVEMLKLRKVSGLKNIVPSIGKKVLNELTSLELDSCNDMEFFIDITRDQGPTVAFSNLVELTIRKMDSLKGLCYGLSPSHHTIASFTRLKILCVVFCDKLKTILSPCLAQSMLCIEELYIIYCNGLEQVIGFAQEEEITKNDYLLCCLPKLRILEICGCRSLKYICANTWTQGLQFLESLNISYCPQFMQIFKMEQNENKQDIVLTGFRPQNHCWPKLKTLKIVDCPVLSCFIVQAQLLEELKLSNVGNKWSTDVPVLNEDCIVVGNHEENIWKDFAKVVTLENLTTLKLSGYKKLIYIFSPTTARSLSNLVDLFIESCEERERLILAKDQVSSSSSNGETVLQPISFPKLTNIIVKKCENLKSLFPFGSILVLPKLESLIVEGNSKLEQVFELEDEVEVAPNDEMKFDKLGKLSLEELSSRIHFSPKGYHFVLSALNELDVRDCPELTTSFSIDSQEFVHCETKEDAIEKSYHCLKCNFQQEYMLAPSGVQYELTTTFT
ncbi:hypothetical protein CXB51_009689 [Gossypium anomalum]|uniref:AAA+ ATPase domain-containing protein n=1 Tax=Gossypium anomalum TaxID=47600 RepID=A0A8J6D2C3_9ROSI|nr:hypothetical protein CXB51_009689 [Gossypium anomalum]